MLGEILLEIILYSPFWRKNIPKCWSYLRLVVVGNDLLPRIKMKKARISTRLKRWDYRSEGSYFITICTQNRIRYFGKIINGEMLLSDLGKIAHDFWLEIESRESNLELGEFVIMPDHIHGILILKENVEGASDVRNELSQLNQSSKKNERMSLISPKANSISAIIRSFKSAVTKQANCLGFAFKWQRGFYDRIIRNEYEFNNVSSYIRQNPSKWP